MIKDMNTGDVPQVNKGVNKNRGKHPGNRTPAQEKDSWDGSEGKSNGESCAKT